MGYVSPSAAASFGFVVETIIRVGGKNHVTGAIFYDIIEVGGFLVEYMVGRSVDELGGSSLLNTKRIEANADIFVNCASIV